MLRSILFYSIVFITMFLGDMFVLFPLLPLLLISPRLYRQLIDRIVGFYWTFPIVKLFIFFSFLYNFKLFFAFLGLHGIIL